MNPDFCDILSAFNEAGVEYLVVGAYALAAHGLVRATGDIDLWVRPTAENASRVIQASKIQGSSGESHRGGHVHTRHCVPNRVAAPAD